MDQPALAMKYPATLSDGGILPGKHLHFVWLGAIKAG
jgi:hypothetical protein